jgi:hypothetical protein
MNKPPRAPILLSATIEVSAYPQNLQTIRH